MGGHGLGGKGGRHRTKRGTVRASPEFCMRRPALFFLNEVQICDVIGQHIWRCVRSSVFRCERDVRFSGNHLHQNKSDLSHLEIHQQTGKRSTTFPLWASDGSYRPPLQGGRERSEGQQSFTQVKKTTQSTLSFRFGDSQSARQLTSCRTGSVIPQLNTLFTGKS